MCACVYVEELYVRSSCVWESDRLFTTLIPFIKPLSPGQASEKLTAVTPSMPQHMADAVCPLFMGDTQSKRLCFPLLLCSGICGRDYLCVGVCINICPCFCVSCIFVCVLSAGVIRPHLVDVLALLVYYSHFN